GGTLAAALAERRQRDLSGLALLAAPWDFHTDGGIAARRAACLFEAFAPLVDVWGELPTDALQVLFASLDPGLVARKFARFGELDPAGAEARAFVALEDWLNDGVPLAGPVARDCLVGWYGGNDTAGGRWLIAGRPVDPSAIRMPVCAIMPARDRIVPPACARSLADAVPEARLIEPALGHIGMVVARDAERQVWRPLGDWLAGVADGRRSRPVSSE
ncbi:MAG TPA: alpha/beta hydrolase, partial [Arenibaculum sp.]|nr:alpha/beta hydrolase [Arenibaculum sp.]